MTFEELQEEITSIGFSNSVVDSDTFRGLAINDQVDNEAILVPIKATNLFDISQSLPNAFTRDQQARISSVLEAYMATPIEKRGLEPEKKQDDQSFTDRLKQERKELIERRKKLFGFLGSPKFIGLPAEQQELMRLQITVMEMYVRILERRLNLLHVKYWDDDQNYKFKTDPRLRSIFDEGDDDDAD